MGGSRRRYVGSILRGRAGKAEAEAEASDSGCRRTGAGMRVRDTGRKDGGKSRPALRVRWRWYQSSIRLLSPAGRSVCLP